MRRITGAILALLVVSGCGGDGGNGPGDVNVQGTWILTFTSSVGSSCSLGQISLTLLADGASPHEGSYASYVVTCTGQQPNLELGDYIVAYQVSGTDFSVQFSNDASNRRTIRANVAGATMSGSFSWQSSSGPYSFSGTFTAAKQ